MVKEKWLDLYRDAVSKRRTLDERFKRQNELYEGTAQPIDLVKGKESKKRTNTNRNMCFELIETQINNAIPQPKITPRDPDNVELANDLEGYLMMEMDRMLSEEINDEAERGVLKHGTGFYMIGWDESKTTPITSGELFVKYFPLNKVYPQPGITKISEAEYIFTQELVSTKKLKKLYNVEIPDNGNYVGMNTLITAWYLNDEGYLSKYGWIENTDIEVFDLDGYELRRIKVCKQCETPINQGMVCPLCGATKIKFKAMEEETLEEDIVQGDPSIPDSEKIIARAGTSIDYYKISELPFVCRVNISKESDLYGVSDIDLMETNQISMNKILSKMEENVLKAGSFVTKPAGVNIPNDDETLKIITVKDPNQIKAFSVQTVQANMQQDNILQEELYQMGRDSIGITDSYQGKRDTTAESGKAKQVSAAQAAGRMESKRRMKDSAYAEIYRLMFKFLLCYCDEKRTYARLKPNGEYVKGSFSRYNYLDGDLGNVYYNDRYIFSVDDASTLLTNRAAMWQETTNNFASGTFGNPADPQTLLLYWNMMKGLNYPLAKQAIASITERSQQLPYELQQAIMQNPEILQAVQTLVQNPDIINKKEGGGNNENNKQ